MLDDSLTYSINRFPGNGSTTLWNLNFSGGYLRQEHVKAYRVNDLTGDIVSPLTITWPGGANQISVSPAVPIGWTLVVYRDTPKASPEVDFVDGSIINEKNLDTLAKQSVFVSAEIADRFGIVAGQSEEAVATANNAFGTALIAEDNSDEAIDTAQDAAADAAQALATASTTAAGFAYLEGLVDDLVGNDYSQMVFFDDLTWTNVTGKPTTFTPSAHTHVISDVTNLQSNLTTLQNNIDTNSTAITALQGRATALEARQNPTGGLAGQILTKNSSTDYDFSWQFPASAAGGLSAVADGAIAAGRSVALTSAGKLKQIAANSIAATAIPAAQSGGSNHGANTNIRIVAIGTNQIAQLYKMSGAGWVVRVGTVTATSITWGSEASVINSASTQATAALLWDATLSRLVVVTADTGTTNPGRIDTFSLSGNTLTFTGQSVTRTELQNCYGVDIVQPTNFNTWVVAARTTAGGTTLSFVAPNANSYGTWTSYGTVNSAISTHRNGGSTAYDPVNNRIVVVNSNSGTLFQVHNIVMTSTTAATLGTQTTYNTGVGSSTMGGGCFLSYDATLNRMVMVTQGTGTTAGNNGAKFYQITYASSTYTITVGTTLRALTDCKYDIMTTPLFYDTQRSRYSYYYIDQSTGGAFVYKFNIDAAGTVTDGSTSLISNASAWQTGAAFKLPTIATGLFWYDLNSGSSQQWLQGVGELLVNTNANQYIGFATSSVADGDTVSITGIGQKNTLQSGLTQGAVYYIDIAGNLSTSNTGYPRVGRALTATDLYVTD